MRIRARIRSYFGFSRIETNGFLILMPLTLLILFYRPLVGWLTVQNPPDTSADVRKLDSLMKSIHWVAIADSAEKVNPKKFKFKPALLKAMPRKKIQKKKHELILLDINEADSAQLVAIRGIGPVRARRISLYRERLGGFIKMAQLKEVYGLDSLVRLTLSKHCFVKEGFEPRRVDINAALPENLTRHPYFSWSQAKTIVLYRFQHGPFHSAEELKAIKGIAEEWVESVKPYLDFK